MLLPSTGWSYATAIHWLLPRYCHPLTGPRLLPSTGWPHATAIHWLVLCYCHPLTGPMLLPSTGWSYPHTLQPPSPTRPTCYRHQSCTPLCHCSCPRWQGPCPWPRPSSSPLPPPVTCLFKLHGQNAAPNIERMSQSSPWPLNFVVGSIGCALRVSYN